MSDPAGELLALEGAMRAPDAVMEPGAADVVARYMRAGGKPEDVIESLTSSYEGCAQMASLVCGWMRLVEAPYAPPGAGAGGSSAFDALPSGAAAAAATTSTSGRGEVAPDEFTLLQELAREKFDPDALLAVFRRGRPTWLHTLAADPRGRRLILDLSAQHPGSLFLAYALRRIFDTGHDEEVAAAGASLSSYFEVYHRLLARRLEAAAAAASSAQLQQLAAELAEACAGGQHTYAHAQHMLTHLAAREGASGSGGPFRRLSQELEGAAVSRQGGAAVWAMQPLFVPRDAPQQQRDAVRLVSRALVLGPGSGGTGGAALMQAGQVLNQLQDLYARQGQPNACELAPLRHVRMLQMLLEGLFSWQQQPTPAVQRTASHLLALAATGQGAPGVEGGGADHGRALAEAQAYIERVRALGSRAAAGEKLDEADLASAEAAARALTLAGLGLLHLAGGFLGSAATYEDDRCLSSAPQLITLLRRAAAAQPARVPTVVRALQAALTAMGARRPELADRVFGALLELLLEGAVAEVLAAAEAWAGGGADPSLVRAFALRVLDRAGPPYSREFARPLLRLLLVGKMGVAKRAGMLGAAGAVERLQQFADECRQAIDFVPGLSDAEMDLLECLAPSR
ncbi:hypothetical protein Rsub_07581 [Raphidocelis subcapitata]|uniref:Uncharacterized protein n=1 Tax=Raphidocelis subcapitata TaxID=307507 RepID=A0A2V0PB24_9CHLO|nr:hypothetical protein Rsub_07581 [Raphidocelis subcapitata]|eukprot:GBF95080.1 hypothetical protein Rsub_07581 [Raphidocelis subcapitata]